MSFSRARKQDFSNLFKTTFIFFFGGGGGGLGGVRGERDQKINVQLYCFYFVSSYLKCLKCVDLIKFSIPTNPWWVIGITGVRDWFNSVKRKWNYQRMENF